MKTKHTVVIDQIFDIPHNLNVSIMCPFGNMGEIRAIFLISSGRLRMQYEGNRKKPCIHENVGNRFHQQ